jgi:NADP-dependent 3-hydroxy acid dehydrogenase YdfG
MERFANKVAIITGAGSGIGQSTAIQIAKEGGKVIVSDIFENRVKETCEMIDKLGKIKAIAAVGDITKQEVIDKMITEAGDKIDILINNAGIMDGFLPTGLKIFVYFWLKYLFLLFG